MLLVGVVFTNVGVLQLNGSIASTGKRAAELKRENAALRLKVARLASSERIQRAAVAEGLVLPSPGDVRYLESRGRLDAEKAANHITKPQPAAPVAATVAPTIAPTTATPVTATPAPQTTTTPAPTTTQTPAPAPTATTTATPTPTGLTTP